LLASARHCAKVQIVQAIDGWTVEAPAGLIQQELHRSFPELASNDTAFHLPASHAVLGRFLRRTAELAVSLPNQAAADYEEQAQAELAKAGPVSTEVERMVRQRVGQDVFRKALLDYWGGSCAVTGIAIPELLRASHAKPWADCATDAERLDAFNGFLLTANLDALFDRGLITFTDAGDLVCSHLLPSNTLVAIGLSQDLHLRWLAPEHHPYLAWHRSQVFQNLVTLKL
jgi:predicted restriction endonuclease